MPQRSAYRWVCLGLLFWSGLLAFFVRLAPAVAIPDLQRAFSLDAAELGLLTALYLWPSRSCSRWRACSWMPWARVGR